MELSRKENNTKNIRDREIIEFSGKYSNIKEPSNMGLTELSLKTNNAK